MTGRHSEERKFSYLEHLRANKWWLLIAAILFGYYVYSKKQSFNNPNPVQKIETTEAYVWPKGCSEEAYRASVVGKNHDTKLPCACADPKYAISDWYEKGLRPLGVSKNSPYYYRIGNDAVGIDKRNNQTKNPLCFNDTRNLWSSKDFFVLKK